MPGIQFYLGGADATAPTTSSGGVPTSVASSSPASAASFSALLSESLSSAPSNPVTAPYQSATSALASLGSASRGEASLSPLSNVDLYQAIINKGPPSQTASQENPAAAMAWVFPRNESVMTYLQDEGSTGPSPQSSSTTSLSEVDLYLAVADKGPPNPALAAVQIAAPTDTAPAAPHNESVMTYLQQEGTANDQGNGVSELDLYQAIAEQGQPSGAPAAASEPASAETLGRPRNESVMTYLAQEAAVKQAPNAPVWTLDLYKAIADQGKAPVAAADWTNPAAARTSAATDESVMTYLAQQGSAQGTLIGGGAGASIPSRLDLYQAIEDQKSAAAQTSGGTGEDQLDYVYLLNYLENNGQQLGGVDPSGDDDDDD